MSLAMPIVKISEDFMEAYMIVSPCEPQENYTVEYLSDALRLNQIKIGIIPENLEKIVANRIFNKEVLVAKGMMPVDGDDGYFEYLFETNLSQKPIILEDGTVDYKNIKMIELVEPGQDIAIYHHGTPGKNGYNLMAQFKLAKKGAELPPLRGSGFEQLSDGITYRATIGGKITEMNNRVNIYPVHELFGDVDLSTGNIEFNGDVIIHGNVLDGMSVKATGTITVDKIVESAYIEGRKGVILRGGVLGKNGATIKSKANITASFFEYARVYAEGDIEADSFLDSNVYAGGKIRLSGKKGCIVGGAAHAVHTIEAMEIGNASGTNTEVSVGVHQESYKQMSELKTQMNNNQHQLNRIEQGLVQFEKTMRELGADFRSDPRRMALVKEKVRLSATIAGQKEQIDGIQEIINASKNSRIEVIRGVHPGVRVFVDEDHVQVKDFFKAVEFKKHMGKIGMFNIGYTSA